MGIREKNETLSLGDHIHSFYSLWYSYQINVAAIRCISSVSVPLLCYTVGFQDNNMGYILVYVLLSAFSEAFFEDVYIFFQIIPE